MPSILAFVRVGFWALAGSLALLSTAGVSAQAQDLPGPKITSEDIRRALIWTGHYSIMSRGDPIAIYRDAFQRWQKSKGYAATDTLPDEQISELLADGARQHDAFGWTTLEDKSIGFSIGVPTRLVKFAGARVADAGLLYSFDGSINYSIVVAYGDLSCARLNSRYLSLRRSVRPFYEARSNAGFAMAAKLGSEVAYARALCRTSGAVLAEVDILASQAPQQELIFSAMADSLRINRDFNPTALPHPRIEPPPTMSDFFTASAKPAVSGKADTAGKAEAIKREIRNGSDLSVEEVFEKASAAVYMVKAGDRMGSAVAIADHELLTNCHVVKDKPRVTLVHDKKEQSANVVSVNEKADRCVLRTDGTLPKWVTVRPYDDIKVGERAITIGTPHGLELTVAEGIVSSKRSHEGSRLVQTTAPISPGSSGGGLFDAQGHLLGITTFYLRTGQNLNFAVAAEDFAK